MLRFICYPQVTF